MIFDFKRGFDNDEALQVAERPIIAISANIMNENSALHFAYSQAVAYAGAVPVIIPANCDGGAVHALMRGVDALLLSGGDDIDARYFGQENLEGLTELNEQRDYYEFMLLRAALDCGLPVMGICRGCQVVNVALGGSIFQDLPTEYEQDLLTHSVLTDKHLPVHKIDIEPYSLLHEVVGHTELNVNSRHHQSVRDVAESLRVVATSSDGVIEGLESCCPSHNILALQCHPENLATDGADVAMQRFFAHLVSEARLYMQAKQLHTLNPIVDSHCDTPMLYEQGGFDFALRNSEAKVDLVKMTEGYLDATITVAYIPQTTPKEQATDKALSILSRFKDDLAGLSDRIVVARSVQDVLRAKARGLKSVMLGLENGLALGDDIDNVDRFKAEGVVYITLCHNGSNDICDSAQGEALHDGVSEFGAKVIERMNALGVTVDVSHSSEKTTMDAVRLSSRPIIASHSSCKELCDHPRNLSDQAIRAIAEKGGVVQVCAYDGFLLENGDVNLYDLIDHIEHIVDLVGYDSVGVGPDFDGGGGIPGFDGANNFINLSLELLRKGHSKEDVAKIMGGNILRVLDFNSNC